MYYQSLLVLEIKNSMIDSFFNLCILYYCNNVTDFAGDGFHSFRPFIQASYSNHPSIYLPTGTVIAVMKSRVFAMHSFEERISHVNFEVEEEPVM